MRESTKVRIHRTAANSQQKMNNIINEQHEQNETNEHEAAIRAAHEEE
jgi:hypothetical protein